MAWFKKKADLPSPPKPTGKKEDGSFDKLMPEIPPAPGSQANAPRPAQQKASKPSSPPPTPPKFPTLNDELSPTPDLSTDKFQSSLSMDQLFEGQGQPEEADKNPPAIDELGFELPDFDENDIRALDEMKSLAPEQIAKKPELIKAEPKPELPPQPELPPEPELPSELPSEADLDIDFSQEMPPEPEQPKAEAKVEELPENEPEPQEEPKDYWTVLSGQPELQPAPMPEPRLEPVMQPRPAPKVISYPEYQRPSQVPEQKFMEVAGYAIMKDELDDVEDLVDSADDAAMRSATLGKMKTDKDEALVAELNSIQEHLILIDNKLFETPNQFIEVKR
jgi:hypothetical protein